MRRILVIIPGFIFIFLFSACIPDNFNIGLNANVDVETSSDLGQDTLDRIDAINDTIATGFEVGPETRDVIKDLNETIKNGVKGGFDEDTLARVDELLRVVEDGFKFGLDTETLAEVNNLVDTIDQMPGQWENAASDVIRVLETTGGTLAGRMANEVKGVMKEARLNAQQLSAAAGVEFRCNVDFMGSKAGASLSEFIGKSIFGKLKAIVTGESHNQGTPIPWVCQIIPDQVELAPAGGKLFFTTGILSLTGYNYVDANSPSAYIVDEAGQRLTSIQLYPYRTSPYQIQLNLQSLDFSLVPPRSRIVFQWPNVPETSAIAILMPGFSSPVASFSANPPSGQAPLTVNFSDTSSNDPTAWQWTFGDGSTSNERNPVHIFTGSGNFQVSLTASNTAGSSTIVQSVNIGDQLVADFGMSNRMGDSPLTIQFQDRSTGNPTSWLWNFGDGSTSNEQNPLHVYTAPILEGYAVSLTINGPQGSASKTSPDRVMVTKKPEARFISDIRSGVVPQTVQFTDQSTGTITSWIWDFGDGTTSTERNPRHTYTESESYDISLTVTSNDGRQDTETVRGYIGLRLLLLPPLIMQQMTMFSLSAYEMGASFYGDETQDTKISAEKYVCGVVGYNAYNGDIYESTRGDILKAYMFQQYSSATGKNTWWVTADFFTHHNHDQWHVKILCFDRAAENNVFTYRDDFRGIQGGTPYNTHLKTADYNYCGIIGQAALDGDINAGGIVDVVWQAYMDGSGSEWKIFADFPNKNTNEKWNFNVLCLKKGSYPITEKPVFNYQTYYLNAVNNNRLSTAIKPQDYYCGITGMSATSADIYEGGKTTIIELLMAPQTTWQIWANFATQVKEEDWRVDTLCINRQYVTTGPPPP